MQAYGSDRIRKDGDRWLLSTRLEKGWTPRVEKTSTSAEFPGTAVLCDEQYFEVVSVDAIPNGVRYTLEPWREQHAMRQTDRYDAESEIARAEVRRAAITHNKRRRVINLVGIFAGHLPADVQEKLGAEYGVFPHWLTLMSTAGMYALAVIGFLVATDRIMKGEIPAWLLIASLLLAVETIFRTGFALMGRRPIGSFIGIISYTIYAAVTGTLVVSDLPKIPDAPEHVAAQDALAMREPLVTLLPRHDQLRVAQRFDYHYERLSPKVAGMILIFAGLGAVTAGQKGHIPGMLVAAGVAAEQLYRLFEFRRGPTGSILGFVVRPMVRKLL